MLIRCAFALTLLLPTASLSQSNEPPEIAMIEAIDFIQATRAEFIGKHEEALAIAWEPTMQLYARIDDSLGELVPQFEWTDDYVEVYGCLYDRLTEQDALGEANAMFSGIQASIEYIYANPDFTMLTMTEHEAFIDMLQPSDLYLEASISCGIGALSAQTMQDSGLVDAFMAFISQ